MAEIICWVIQGVTNSLEEWQETGDRPWARTCWETHGWEACHSSRFSIVVVKPHYMVCLETLSYWLKESTTYPGTQKDN